MVQEFALVAGGAGFIGSNLCAALLKQNFHVDCVDNFVTGHFETIKPLLDDENFRLVEADVCDSSISSCLPDRNYSIVANLACPTGVPNITKLGEEMMLASSLGTLNLLRIACACHAKFLFLSSAEVYGNAEAMPLKESYVGHVDPVGPRSSYEEGKRFGEALTAFYAKAQGLDARIARVFNTYGPGMSKFDTRVVPQFVSSSISGEPISIYGNGKQTRCFLYVDDLIDALMLILSSGEKGGIYNVGSDKETTIVELSELVQDLTDRKLSVRRKPHFIEDHVQRVPDISKIRKLGWQPSTPLRDGLQYSYLAMRSQFQSSSDKSTRAADKLAIVGTPA